MARRPGLLLSAASLNTRDIVLRIPVESDISPTTTRMHCALAQARAHPRTPGQLDLFPSSQSLRVLFVDAALTKQKLRELTPMRLESGAKRTPVALAYDTGRQRVIAKNAYLARLESYALDGTLLHVVNRVPPNTVSTQVLVNRAAANYIAVFQQVDQCLICVLGSQLRVLQRCTFTRSGACSFAIDSSGRLFVLSDEGSTKRISSLDVDTSQTTTMLTFESKSHPKQFLFDSHDRILLSFNNSIETIDSQGRMTTLYTYEYCDKPLWAAV
eukprot:TRINITY_DN5293_c0_g1_i1.p1 TRINITY_DN5293_c0_g1~~TRINITY_DN5293_c0_g1_i1.p1  ORF type:complete len:271 (-),score=12.59 TRINITY_DN5293_c0_g1_i1:84-896(-)